MVELSIVIPAYNEEDNIGQVLPRIPATVCGLETAVLVVDDGSRDRTGDIARSFGAAVARHVTNLGGGAALRTGYRLMVDSGARIVVTLDADGQHRPEEMERLVGEPWTPRLLREKYDELQRRPIDYTSQLPPRLDRRYIVTGGSGKKTAAQDDHHQQ